MLESLLMDSWRFFKNHAVAISMIVLPIVVPIEVFTGLYQYFFPSEKLVLSEQLIPVFIGFLAYPVYAIGIVFYMASVISGEPIEPKTSWVLGIRFWFPYVMMSILVYLAVMVGFALFIVPGVIFAIRYSFSEFDLLLNQTTPFTAIKNSWNATKEYMWVILGGYALITLVLSLPASLIILISYQLDDSSIFYWMLDTASNIVYSVLAVLYTIFAFRVYEFAKLKR